MLISVGIRFFGALSFLIVRWPSLLFLLYILLANQTILQGKLNSKSKVKLNN